MSMIRRAFVPAVWLGLALCVACSGDEGGNMNAGNERIVRRAVGAGQWFPGDRGELQAAVDGYLAEAQPPAVHGRIVAAIAPHAGYQYSGKVAGYTFRAIRDNARESGAPETVVVIGFAHRVPVRGVALLDGDALATPLRETALDKEAAHWLTQSNAVLRLYSRPHAGEWSAENQIPFVQTALPEAKLVVALMGDHEPRTVDALLAALGDLARKRKILVVASTDLLHDPDYDLVTKTDQVTLGQIGALDYTGLAKRWQGDFQVCCGIGPVLTALRFAAAQGCQTGTVLRYRNSGDDVPSSRGSWVVGYGAVVFAAAE